MIINTFENIINTREVSLESISFEIKKRLDELCSAYKAIMSLIPEDVNKLFSGHIFPYLESYNELENSINFLWCGLYKQALISLRSCFELGLVYIYFDRSNDSEVKIQEWMHSLEDTPFRKKIISGLSSISNIDLFFYNTEYKIRIDYLYSELSNYVHTCGYKYSISKLNRSNITVYNPDSFDLVEKYIEEIITILIMLFLLKYPIGMHFTPIDDKFGLNAPIGTFLQPDQAGLIKRVIPDRELRILEEICLNDPSALELAKWVNSQPDLSAEEWERQVREEDKREISEFGFSKWLELCSSNLGSDYKIEMKKWAIDNGYNK